jgi:hypothetical protein
VLESGDRRGDCRSGKCRGRDPPAILAAAPSRAIARDFRASIMADYAESLPAAVKCFDDDLEASIAHLRLPVTHRRSIRATKLIERLFGEERRDEDRAECFRLEVAGLCRAIPPSPMLLEQPAAALARLRRTPGSPADRQRNRLVLPDSARRSR